MGCNTPFRLIIKGVPMEVPCRRCMGCRIAKRNYMSMLARFEVYSYHQNGMGSSFITLTYDDDNLPYNGSLDINESKKFIKRLRQYLVRHHFPTVKKNVFGELRDVPDFKYYICGEYGDKDGRPHYHAIIFGVPSNLMNEFVRHTWKKGLFKVSPINNARIRYCMKYMDKQYNTNSAYWNKDDVINDYTQPFSTWSHGIGTRFLLQHLDEIYSQGGIIQNGRLTRLSNYFNKKYGIDSQDFLRLYRSLSHEAFLNGFNSVRDYILSNRYNNELTFYKRNLLSGSASYQDYYKQAKLELESCSNSFKK